MREGRKVGGKEGGEASCLPSYVGLGEPRVGQHEQHEFEFSGKLALSRKRRRGRVEASAPSRLSLILARTLHCHHL
ncbi:hypothetical protein E2C01_056245 [Portunus trituberculatus]|uniref:Uncharacterized protein n=1 Tax=Portunus trituberculatus TaxID=210409 RepID=A0A5B7GTK5_PORTR|nr:hypothetical protein [Portunus trituberculatus]